MLLAAGDEPLDVLDADWDQPRSFTHSERTYRPAASHPYPRNAGAKGYKLGYTKPPVSSRTAVAPQSATPRWPYQVACLAGGCSRRPSKEDSTPWVARHIPRPAAYCP